MTPGARYDRALELRNKGLTLRNIGSDLGVSRERARQIILKAERMRARNIAGRATTFCLSVRAQNILWNLKMGTGLSRASVRQILPQLRAGVFGEPREKYIPGDGIKNLGIVTLCEIETWLEEEQEPDMLTLTIGMAG